MKSLLPALIISSLAIVGINQFLPSLIKSIASPNVNEPFSSEELVSNLKSAESKLGYGKAPSFSLKDQDGNHFSPNKLSGPWLLNLFFTECDGPCPMTLSKLKKLDKAIGKNTPLTIVSVTVDTENDDSKQLKKYALENNLNTPRWQFLSGSNSELFEIVEKGFQIGVMSDPKFHSTRLVLVGSNGDIKGYYSGVDSDDMKKLALDIKNL